MNCLLYYVFINLIHSEFIIPCHDVYMDVKVMVIFLLVQASNYDPEGEYVAHWLPSLKQLPPKQRNSPGDAYLRPIVPLKFGMGGGGKPNYDRFGKNKNVGKVSRR